MVSERESLRYALARSAHAEFTKIWASRVPLVFLLSIPVGCYLVVFELYHMEHIREHLPVRHALDVVPMLFYVVWKMMLFQAAVLAFAAFWATVDSQYGMVRVVGAQPLSRVEYLLGKWLGISGHVVILTIALIVSVVGWAAIYSGVRGIGARELMMLLRFSVEILALTVALGGVGLATASFRRTIGSGMVTAMVAFIGLSVMMMLPFDVLPPRFVFVRYFFFPMQEFPSPFPGGDNIFLRLYSLSDFYTVVIGTPLILAIPAILYFRRRDITE
jgi:ABC-type transport system involved in multi-copper enzyme maturation permease subunit